MEGRMEGKRLRKMINDSSISEILDKLRVHQTLDIMTLYLGSHLDFILHHEGAGVLTTGSLISIGSCCCCCCCCRSSSSSSSSINSSSKSSNMYHKFVQLCMKSLN